jgi:nucleoside-diphosphate-sugar epimerase
MDNVITACKEASCKLIFFDNVYMYGPVSSPMTEDLPFQPTSAKGRVRATIARQLLVEMRADRIDALIARSADFYGPHGDKSSVPNMMVFGNMAKGKKAQWLCNAEVPHSYTYIPDAARSLYLLSGKKEAFGETWHVPTAANPLTGREFVAAAASAMGVQNAVTVLPKWMMSLGGLFDRTIKEATEMAYQSELPYLFDSSKFNAAFSFEPTSYEEGIKCAAEKYKASV